MGCVISERLLGTAILQREVQVLSGFYARFLKIGKSGDTPQQHECSSILRAQKTSEGYSVKSYGLAVRRLAGRKKRPFKAE